MSINPLQDTELERLGVGALSTRPNQTSRYGEGGLTAEQLKAAFDRLPLAIAAKVNEIIDALSEGDVGTGNGDYAALSDFFGAMFSSATSDENLVSAKMLTAGSGGKRTLDQALAKTLAAAQNASDKATGQEDTILAVTLGKKYGIQAYTYYDGTTIAVTVDEAAYRLQYPGYGESPNDPESRTFTYVAVDGVWRDDAISDSAAAEARFTITLPDGEEPSNDTKVTVDAYLTNLEQGDEWYGKSIPDLLAASFVDHGGTVNGDVVIEGDLSLADGKKITVSGAEIVDMLIVADTDYVGFVSVASGTGILFDKSRGVVLAVSGTVSTDSSGFHSFVFSDNDDAVMLTGFSADKASTVEETVPDEGKLLVSDGQGKVASSGETVADILDAAADAADEKIAEATSASALKQKIGDAAAPGGGSLGNDGLMTAEDKAALAVLVALLGAENGDGDTVVNTIREVLAAFSQFPEGVNIAQALSGKADKADVNESIENLNTAISNLISSLSGKVDTGTLTTTLAGYVTTEALASALAGKADTTALSSFLEKVSGANKIYGTTSTGAQTSFSVSETAAGSAIAKRNYAGHLLGPTVPTAYNHYVVKQWVEQKIAAAAGSGGGGPEEIRFGLNDTYKTVNITDPAIKTTHKEYVIVVDALTTSDLHCYAGAFQLNIYTPNDVDQMEIRYVRQSLDNDGNGSGFVNIDMFECPVTIDFQGIHFNYYTNIEYGFGETHAFKLLVDITPHATWSYNINNDYVRVTVEDLGGKVIPL